jgi:2,4-dienoyl-CoA reductase-like NADH-dependent reductase (Old Yellow Enzyme family)
MVEATAVTSHGRISPSDTGIWNDKQAAAFHPITDFLKASGAVAGIQLAHAGRKAGTAEPWNGGKPIKGLWDIVGPSALAFDQGYPVPRTMSERDMDDMVQSFRSAAQRALTAGFQVIEIHMAHGYLLHEFLSPLTNQRNDSYGGSLDNRMRFPLRIVHSVREVWPSDLPVFVRISGVDWVDGGWDLEQSIELSKQLKLLGVDLIDVSSGGLLANAKIPVTPGYQVPLAQAIRDRAAIPTAAVGLITTGHQAEDILRNGHADAVMIGREFLRDPYFPLKAARELGETIAWPKQYMRARG